MVIIEKEKCAMALIKCPECGRENVSDMASSCPNCGFGIKEHFDIIKVKKENEQKKETERKNKIYSDAKDKYQSTNLANIVDALKLFESLLDWKDSKEMVDKCSEKIQKLKIKIEQEEVHNKNNIYKNAVEKLSSNLIDDVIEAKKLFESILEWNNSKEMIDKCKSKIKQLESAKEEKRLRQVKCIKIVVGIVIVLAVIAGISHVFYNMYEANIEKLSIEVATEYLNGEDVEESIRQIESKLKFTNSSEKHDKAKELLRSGAIVVVEKYIQQKQYEESYDIYCTISDELGENDELLMCKGYAKGMVWYLENNYLQALKSFERGGYVGQEYLEACYQMGLDSVQKADDWSGGIAEKHLERAIEYLEKAAKYDYKDSKELIAQINEPDSDTTYAPVSSVSSYTGAYDAVLKYSGTSGVLICISEDAMERFMTAVNNDNEGTLQELFLEGQCAYTEQGTKCNIVDKKFTKAQVKLLDGSYAGNTVWVVIESLHEE